MVRARRARTHAAVIGDTLMLSRGLLDSPHLPAVLAHELGHLGSPDGRVTAALNRLMIHPPIYDLDPREREHHEPFRLEFNNDTLYIIAVTTYITVWCTKMLAKGCRGGLGLYLTRPLWGSTGASASTPPTSTPHSSARPTSSPTSWKSTG